MQKWSLYLARCKDMSLYVGISSAVTERLERHNSGDGSRWIQQHGEATIVYTEGFDTYAAARCRETQIKKWSRKKKENLILGLKP